MAEEEKINEEEANAEVEVAEPELGSAEEKQEEEDMEEEKEEDKEQEEEKEKEEDMEEEEDKEQEEEKEAEEDDFIPLGGKSAAKAKGDETSLTSGGISGVIPPWHRKESVSPGFPLRTLHNEILDLCDLLMPTPEEKAQTETAIAYVRKVVHDILGPRTWVDVFGSQLTGLVLPSSDIDAVVMGGPNNGFKIISQEMYKRKNRSEVRDVTVISKAKVPLVKFVHAATGLQVDVCFDQESGVKSGESAKTLMRQMPPIRPLVMVLKAYMGQRKLNETYHGGVGSFLLQLMVVALVQKCGREAREKGQEPPTNLGFFLDEFFDLYGNQLNYAAAGITLLGDGGGGFFNKQEIGWFMSHRAYALSVQNPHETTVDVGSNSYKVDVCKQSFKATSLRLKCALQRAIRHESEGGSGDGAEMEGFLKYVVHPGGALSDRVLPPPTFCTRIFDEEDDEIDDGEEELLVKEAIKKKAQSMMNAHGSSGKGSSRKAKRKASGAAGYGSKRRKPAK